MVLSSCGHPYVTLGWSFTLDTKGSHVLRLGEYWTTSQLFTRMVSIWSVLGFARVTVNARNPGFSFSGVHGYLHLHKTRILPSRSTSLMPITCSLFKGKHRVRTTIFPSLVTPIIQGLTLPRYGKPPCLSTLC
jgi:hypothetical protein